MDTRRRHVHPEATVRIGGSLAVPAVLRSLGADPAAVFAEAGVDLALFDDPDNLISFAARSHLFRVCVNATGCPHFGLLVGQHNGLDSLGLVGLLVKYSPDVGTALHSLVRYAHHHVRGAVITLEVDGSAALFGYAIYQGKSEATDQIADGAIASALNILRSLCGPGLEPNEARFAHREPADIKPFRRFFGCPLSFDAGQNAVVFPAVWLDHRLPVDDPALRRLLQQQIDTLEAKHGDDLPEQVRRVLRTALLTRHASAEQVAALLSMHSRTLARRLAAVDTHFQALVDEARFEIAQQLLEGSAMDLRQITATLDYADPSAFTRAFRRWSGTTPARWRAKRVA